MDYPYLSKRSGVGGSRGPDAEDFVVEEIGLDGRTYELNETVENQKNPGNFCISVLQKKNWDTHQAIKAVSGALGLGRKRSSVAGTKDRCAVTTQLVSFYRVAPERVMSVKIKDISFLGAWYSDDPIEMGDLMGNRFKIRIVGSEENPKRVNEIWEDLNGHIPNYFGPQRFGNRKNTGIVGKYIVERDFQSAVMEYLVGSSDLEKESIREVRKNLAESLDYSAALGEFPKHLRYERTLIAHLAKYQNDYVGALRRLPRTLALMFVHAYQAYLFNEMLGERLTEGNLGVGAKCGINEYGFPEIDKPGEDFAVGNVIGYETSPDEYEHRLLEKEGITTANFKITACQELSSKGSRRPYLSPVKNFVFEKSTLRFELPSGAYATCLLREFLDKKG
jgi:tRNA pseudouridine13 synthase